MKKMSKKIIFFGNERLATGVITKNPVLNALISEGYEIECVILSQDSFDSRNGRINETEILARENNIPCYKPKNKEEIKKIINDYQGDLAVLVAYGKLIPEEIINFFPLGIVNLHPSLLPDKRGPTPIEESILKGDEETGVSVMKLTKGMDTGPLFVQKSLKLSGNESKQDLSNSLGELGAHLIVKVLPSILSSTLEPIEQSQNNITTSRLISKSDGIVDWNNEARNIERKIRAYFGWPRSTSSLLGKKVIITDVIVLDDLADEPGKIIDDPKRLIVSCSDYNLEILKLIPENKKEISGKEFIAGYRK
jgi:methionyl-tRNA formyltransferase